MNQQEPVNPEEFILRRIHRNYYDAKQPIPVLPAAFRPTHDDVAGLSVFREKHISAAAVASAGRSPGAYHVVRLSVQALNALGLTVAPDDEPGSPPGHALIVELGLSAYRRDKARLKSVLMELARLSSQAVVHRPDH